MNVTQSVGTAHFSAALREDTEDAATRGASRGPLGTCCPLFGAHGHAYNVHSLEALGALLDFELDRLVLLETAVTLPLDSLVVDEDIRAILLGYEAITLLRAEPLDSASCHVPASSFLSRDTERRSRFSTTPLSEKDHPLGEKDQRLQTRNVVPQLGPMCCRVPLALGPRAARKTWPGALLGLAYNHSERSWDADLTCAQALRCPVGRGPFRARRP